MGSTFGVDGVISGLKTQDLITQLMALERRPVQLLQRQVDKEATKLAAVNGIKSTISALQAAVLSLTRAGTINAKSATTDTPTTSAAVLSAVANGDAVNGSFKVTVNQIATATNVLSTSPIGAVINKTATLGNAGFRVSPTTAVNGNPATFSINGRSISVDANTTLDDGTANSLIGKINAAGAGVTASLIADTAGRADNRVQIVSDPGQALQLGSGADTSNIFKLLNLSDAVIQGNSASSVTGGGVTSGLLNTSITINGVTTAINQNNAGFSDVQNAGFIANAINQTSGSTVTAVDNGDGTLTLQQKTLGAGASIVISGAGAETGFTAGTTKNGTDKIVSSMALGVADIGQSLANARLVTPIAGLDAGGNGKLTINGVDIGYKSTDTVASVINRINSSSAGVSAFYDPVQDKLRITSGQTGAKTITLADQTGNFLAATGVLGASQTLGNNALFSIDSVNNGQQLASSTNTVSGYVPGVTVTLKSASATPVTVTVGQNTDSTAGAVKTFVDKFNAVLDAIDDATAYDSKTKTAATLAGDSSVLQIKKSLMNIVADSVQGGQGKYTNLAAVGISTGSVGTGVSDSYRLQLDTTKLANALQDNPLAVTNLLAGFSATVGTPAGTGNLASVSGTPFGQHDAGNFKLQMLDTSGNVKVTFVTADGRTTYTKTGALSAGQANTTLIPGMTLTAAGSFTVGTTTIGMAVDTKGAAVRANDYVNGLLDSTAGFFASRQNASQAITKSLTARITDMNARLDLRQTELSRRFTALEATMARIQTQGAAVASAITQMQANSSAR